MGDTGIEYRGIRRIAAHKVRRMRAMTFRRLQYSMELVLFVTQAPDLNEMISAAKLVIM